MAAFKELITEEQKAIEFKSVTSRLPILCSFKPVSVTIPETAVQDEVAFNLWKTTNLIPQKQEGFVAIGIKVLLGDFYTDKARLLANLVMIMPQEKSD